MFPFVSAYDQFCDPTSKYWRAALKSAMLDARANRRSVSTSCVAAQPVYWTERPVRGVGDDGLKVVCTIGPLLRRGTTSVTPPLPAGTFALTLSFGLPFPM